MKKKCGKRLSAVEQSTKSAHHRIDGIEKLTESVHIIATETKAMREDVNDITSRGRRNRKTSYKAIRNSSYRHYYGISRRFDRLFY